MPICGFNQEMLEGLEKVHTALAEQLITKLSDKEIADETKVGEEN